MSITPEARDQVIRTLIGEAGNQGPDGWRGVAHVIKNRIDSGAWGPIDGAVGRVIHAPLQFSMYNPGNSAGDVARAATPNSPIYQRIGQVVDSVFAANDPDNTQGATHFFNPNASTGTPRWAAQGTNVRQIGDHTFMTLPLTPDSTAGTILTSYKPSVVSNDFPPGGDVGQARTFLSAVSGHPGRPGDTSNLHPDFALKMAAALKDASNQGLHLSLSSGFRTPGQTGSAYDAAGDSSHTYGLAADIGGLDGPNGPKTQLWAQIAAAHGLSNPYGIGSAKEFNHWQLLPYPLETHPDQLAALKAAYASGDQNAVWNAASPVTSAVASSSGDPRAEDVTANRITGMAAPPATQPFQPAQPLPVHPGQAPTAAVPAPALGAPDPNARFQLNTGLTTQGGPRPQMYTSLNLGGGAASPAAPAPAAATPAVAPVTQPGQPPIDLNNPPQPVPRPITPQAVALSQTPLPPPRPTNLAFLDRLFQFG